jgi:hypothetical protein
MKPQIEPRQIISSAESTVFKLNNSDIALRHLTQLVVIKQYSDPQLASIREIVSNAYDANLECQAKDGVKRSVDIKVTPDRVIIRDYGTGLSEKQMLDVEDGYGSITKSTKHDSQDLIGAKGIGRLAPLAVSKQYFVTSYHSGYKSTYCVFLNENSEIAISLWDQVDCDEPTGLEVTILCPNKNKDLRRHITDLVQDVYAVVEGSRHQINLDLKMCELTGDLVWLNDYYIDSAVEEDFTVDLYSKRKLNSANPSFSTNIYVDLGGALYPVKGSRSAMSEFYKDHIIDKSYTWYSDDHNFEPMRGGGKLATLIIRVSPDYLVLNTSREAILNQEEQQKKLKALVERAEAATAILHTQYVQKTIQAEYNKLTDTETPWQKLHSLFLAAKRASRTLAYMSTNYDNSEISFNLGDGWTCSAFIGLFQSNQGYDVEVVDKHINLKFGGGNTARDYYFLTNSHYLLNGLKTDSYKWGVNKVVPKATRRESEPRLTNGALLNNKLAVVYYPGYSILSIKKLEKFFSISLKDKPVAVLTQKSVFERIKLMHPLVTVLGEYKTDKPDSEPEDRAPITREMPEVSILMRQLKQSIFTRNGQTVREDITAELTPALLNEKVIYFNKDWSGIEKHIANNVPSKYLTEYHELAVFLSDNAYDRVDKLVSKGDCNWVKADLLKDKLKTGLYKDYGYLVNYIGLGSDYGRDTPFVRQKILNILVNKGLGEYLPDLTRSLAKCPDRLTEAFKQAASSPYDCAEANAKLFAPYKGEYTNSYKTMLGPLLSLYYDYLVDNYGSSESQEQIYADIAFRLKAENASIYK